MADEYRCSMCDEAFQSGQDLEKHNGEMHADGRMGMDKGKDSKEDAATSTGVERVTATTGAESFACDRCSSVYPSRAALAEHAAVAAHSAA